MGRKHTLEGTDAAGNRYTLRIMGPRRMRWLRWCWRLKGIGSTSGGSYSRDPNGPKEWPPVSYSHDPKSKGSE